MKNQVLISLIIFALMFLNNRTSAQAVRTNKPLLDSLQILKDVGGFVDGYTNPPTAEETRYYNIAQSLFSLPFSEAKKLLRDKNKFARCYGFSISTKMHFDSLTKTDLEIFKDTSSLPLYTQRGVIDAGITVGQFCEMAYASTTEAKKKEAKQSDVIKAVKFFITSNARFPDSYEPLTFKDYRWGGSSNDMFYEICHSYKLKQNNGEMVSVQDYFILGKDFAIMLIEKNRSNTIKSVPPKIEEWTKFYGKK